MFRVYLCRPCGFAYECPDMGSYLFSLGMSVGWQNARSEPSDQVSFCGVHASRQRIHVCRNQAVDDAREFKATHLMFMDPDIVVDAYVGLKSWAKRWWPEAWKSAIGDRKQAVLGAPYVGQAGLVQVFDLNRQRFQADDVSTRSGWERIGAIGTGLLLIDMKVFDRLDETGEKMPYFADAFEDWRQAKMIATQDLFFCERCRKAGIPIYVNWDCWCAHWQNQPVLSPRVDDGGTQEEPEVHETPEAAIADRASGQVPADQAALPRMAHGNHGHGAPHAESVGAGANRPRCACKAGSAAGCGADSSSGDP